MATKILTDIIDLPFVWWLTRNGKDIQPTDTGRLGAFPIGTILTINLSVIADHECFTIDPNDPGKHIAKKDLGTGVYQKKITIVEGNGQGLAPRWPNNVICLDADDRHFTIGIQQQRGIFYFVVEEYTQTNDQYTRGRVRWFSVLRGIGAVYLNPLEDARIHWSNLPKREAGLRYVNSGEVLKWCEIDLVDTPVNRTIFSKEIFRAELA